MKRILTAAFCGLLFAPGALWADGESRPAMKAEKDFVLRVMTAFDKALPAAPAGWQQAERTKVAAPERMGMGEEENPLRVFYQAQWRDQERLKAFDADAEAIGRTHAEKMAPSASEEVQQKQVERLAEALGAAVAKGDVAEVQRLQKKMEAAANALNQAYSERDARFTEAIRSREPHDVRVEIQIAANDLNVDLSHEFTEEPPVAGAKVVRINDEGHTNFGWQEGLTVAVLGKWRLTRDHPGMAAEPDPGRPHTAVQTVVVGVRAEKARARRLLEGIDWAALKALFKP